jgi:hypothetical protein
VLFFQKVRNEMTRFFQRGAPGDRPRATIGPDPFGPVPFDARMSRWDAEKDPGAEFAPLSAPTRNVGGENRHALLIGLGAALAAALAGRGDGAAQVAAAGVQGARRGAGERFKARLDAVKAENLRRSERFKQVRDMTRDDNSTEGKLAGIAARFQATARQGEEAKANVDDKAADNARADAGLAFNKEKFQVNEDFRRDGLAERSRLGGERLDFTKQNAFRMRAAARAKQYRDLAADPRTDPATRSFYLQRAGEIDKSVGVGATDAKGTPIIGPGGLGGRTEAERVDDGLNVQKHTQAAQEWAGRNKLDWAKLGEAQKKRVTDAARNQGLDTLKREEFELKKAHPPVRARAKGEENPIEAQEGLLKVGRRVIQIDKDIARELSRQNNDGKDAKKTRMSAGEWNASRAAVRRLGFERAAMAAETKRLQKRMKPASKAPVKGSGSGSGPKKVTMPDGSVFTIEKML